MGLVQELAPSPETALETGAAMGGQDRTVRSAVDPGHVGIRPYGIRRGNGAAFARMGDQYRGLYATEDFREGRKAEAEGRPLVCHGC